MHKRLLFPIMYVLFFVAAIAADPVAADPPSLLRMFGRTPAVEADSSKVYELSEEDGPWLILASTLVGEGAKERAQKLALEIRSDLGLVAFIYNENFDFTGTVNFDRQTAKRARYANRYQYEAYAVLVGEYDSSSHPDIERDLAKVKTATPRVLQDPDEVAAETNSRNPVTAVKAMASKWKNSFGEQKGPMATAFVTRNPMLPEEYFQSPPVDSFVHQLNEGLEHSLLKCDGKFTVIVKTFQGVATLENGKKSGKLEPSSDRMAKLAARTQKMTQQLRSQGVQAYQFHDRDRSIVTVGSFDTLGRELPGGQFEYNPEIAGLMKKYSALNVRPELARQVPGGSKGVAGNNVGMVPFDVQPTPIAVPKLSKRSLYGMR